MRAFPPFNDGYTPARLSGPGAADFRPEVVILTAAQRARLRWWAEGSGGYTAVLKFDRRDVPTMYALETRGLVRWPPGSDVGGRCCRRDVPGLTPGIRYVMLTAAGAAVLDHIRKDDTAERARFGRVRDLYADRRYLIPRFCGTVAADDETILYTDAAPMCPACGSRTTWFPHPNGREHHQCNNTACDFPFFAEPDPS